MSKLDIVMNLFNKEKRILFFNHFKISKYIDDKKYLQMLYKAKTGDTLNLENPNSFGEKLQWIKIYDRNPLYTSMVDKIAAKEYVARILGSQYIIPNLGIWDSPEQIDFQMLPEKFVLKCNHNSGLGMVICKDKSKLDIKKTKALLKKGLKEDFFSHAREWPYKNVDRKILAEKFMENNQGGELNDYKFYCFNGEPHFCQVICNRTTNETIDFFDIEWNLQEFTGLELPYKPHASKIDKPICLEEMIRCAKILSKNIPFVRIDFYEISGKMYFGEMTFFPAAGMGKFHPDSWNQELGELIQLPKN